MSKDNVKKLFGKIEKDAGLQKKYAALVQAHAEENEKKLAEKLVELGKTSGFAFSHDDLTSARAEIMDKINSNKELSDGDLANVAGGGISAAKNASIVGSVFSLGIACAILSMMMSKRPKGEGCAEHLTIREC